MQKEKQVRNSREIVVKIDNKDVVIFKSSNVYKVGEAIGYLTQIVWEEATESVISEITEQLQK